jgi:hypothetical protein
MTSDHEFFDTALGRIDRMMVVLGAVGVAGAAVWRGWAWGAGFALGAAASWLSFRWIKRFVYAIGGSGPTKKRVAVLAGLRYLLLGGGAYVILHYSRISLPAALAGLFVSAGAVIVEIIFQLVYART